MSVRTSESHRAIAKLIYRYAECVDRADFAGLSELFSQGNIRSSSAAEKTEGMTGTQVGRFYAATNRVHEDGTLCTRHISSNLIIDVDEEAGSARVRSDYAVLQATRKLPFQVIVAGRYEDRFSRIDGEWQFTERVIHVDQIGNMSEHLNFDLAKGNIRYEEVVPPRD